jgi:hypothetical protein
MNPDRPPSALQFAKLLRDGPRIPDLPNFHVEHQMTAAELDEQRRRSEEAREKIRELVKNMRAPK